MGSAFSPDILIYGIIVFVGAGIVFGILPYLKRKRQKRKKADRENNTSWGKPRSGNRKTRRATMWEM